MTRDSASQRTDRDPLLEYEVALDNRPNSPEHDEVHVTVYARSNQEAAEKAYRRADKGYPEYADAPEARIVGRKRA